MNMDEKEKAAYKAFLKDLRDIASAQHTKMIDAKLEEESRKRRKEEEQKVEELQKKAEKIEKDLEEKRRQIKEIEIGKTKIDAIISLDKNGIAIEIIANSFQLTIEEVQQILDEYKS